jgi:hypothetical protein
MQKLLVSPAIDEDVDGGVDDKGKVVEVDEVLQPVWPAGDLAMQSDLDAFIHVDDGTDGMTKDKDLVNQK